MALAISVGGEAEIAEVNAKERREHNAMSDRRIDRAIVAVFCCVYGNIGVVMWSGKSWWSSRILYSHDAYR